LEPISASALAAPPASPTGDPQSDLTFYIPPAGEQDSIFSEPAQAGDDLFGEEMPRVEMPAEPTMPRPEINQPTEPGAPAPFDVARESAPTTPKYVTVPMPATADAAGASDLALGSGPMWPATPSATSLSGMPSGLISAAGEAPMVRMPGQRTWLLPLLVVPLISYSILSTIAVGFLWFRLQRQVHPLEALPDQGDNQGAQHGRRTGALDKMPTPDQDLPSRLHVALGKSIRIGDIEVTPTRVERRRIRFKQEGGDADPTDHESLALHLRLRNVSEDVYFKPLDSYFDRRWKLSKPAGIMPYTFLTLSDKRFFGGPLDWQPHSASKGDRFRDPRMLVVGQDHDKELGPGEEMTTFICTDPQDKATAALDKMKDKGPYIWRVQVRRGLVQVGDRELSATAVVGVEFNRSDVQ
jgi:hypothetical protein